MKNSNRGMIISGIALGALLMSTYAFAALRDIKAYKEIYPDAKLKCSDCHALEHPKKEDGQHDLNDYGKAVVKAAGTAIPTAEVYKTVGKIEDFKK